MAQRRQACFETIVDGWSALRVESAQSGVQRTRVSRWLLGVLDYKTDLVFCEQLSISFFVRPDGHAGLLTITNELAGFSTIFLLTNDSE
jgi:hypothetical protein